MVVKRTSNAVVFLAALVGASLVYADDGSQNLQNKHVLLISIDGMHTVNYANCVSAGTCPNLAALGKTGVNYTRTTTQ